MSVRAESDPVWTPETTSLLLPALGHFGGTAADHLQITVGASIRSLKLSLDSTHPEFLNLRGIHFFSQGRRLDIEPTQADVRQSSYRKSDTKKDPRTLLRLHSIHTDKEASPYWEIVFHEPIFVDRVDIYNRPDGWGFRSRSLLVETVDEEGLRQTVHQGRSAQAVRDARDLVTSLCPDLAFPEKQDDHSSHRRQVVEALSSLLRQGPVVLSSQEWNILMSYLPADSKFLPTDDDWYLLASYLLYQRMRNNKTSTGVRSFSLLLNSRARLKRLESEFDSISELLGIPPQFIARHGIRNQGVLRQNSTSNLQHMREIVLHLQQFGHSSMLAYGTLLGAIRDGQFVAHDDDVDLLWLTQASSLAETVVESDALVRRLQSIGYTVRRVPNYLNIHVADKNSGAVVDLFPVWTEGNQSFLHMEGMKIRAIETKLLTPPRLACLENQLFPVPHDAPGFLEERYGKSWTIADPYFEWRWALTD